LTVKFHPLLSYRILAPVAAMLACDQVSKVVARSCLSSSRPPILFGGLLSMPLARNFGSFLGLGSHSPSWVRFLVFSVGGWIGVGLCLLFLAVRDLLSDNVIIALQLILAGTLGNQIDRILFHGAVTDFLFLSAGPVHTGIFNIADMMIMAGSGLVLVESVMNSRRKATNC